MDEYMSQRGMRFSKSIVELQRFFGCRPRLRKCIRGRCSSIMAKEAVRVSQPGIGEGIARIFAYCLVKIVDRCPKVCACALVPKKPPFQVKLMSLGIFGGPLINRFFFGTGQLG